MNEEIITLDIQDDSVVVNVEDETQVIEYTEDTKYIEIEEPQMVVIEVEEGVSTTGSVGGSFAPIEHHHQIEEIDDLRDELDTLGLTQDHYSAHGGYAEFREWKSNGSYKTEDMYKGTGGIGFFVSLVSETGKTSGGNTRIDVCKQVGDDIADVYGVTVIDSGFCGYQHKEYNLLVPSSPNYSNPNYAKVCLLGNADVRITYDTLKELQKSGGYVVPDNNGYAKKSTNNIGFKVISIGEKEAVGNESTAWYYANIALVPQNDNVSRVMQELDKARVNLNNVTIQLGEMRGEVDKVYGVDIGISEKFDNIQSIVNSNQAQVQEGLAAAQTVAQTAQEIAKKAQAQMETSASQYIQALNIANGAQEAVSKATEDIGKIKSEMDILAKWPEVDDKNATQSVAGFVAQASKNNATLGALTEVFGDNGSDYTAILQKINASGASIQHIVTHVDKYTLGEYSPTYNLSQDETVILGPGHIYVPTKDTDEKSYIYTCNSQQVKQDDSCYFIIDNQSYMFKAPQDIARNTVLKFHTNSRRLFIGDDAFDVKTIIDTNGMTNIGTFSVEYKYSFKLGKSYEWRANDVGLYDWVDYKSVSMATGYKAGENDGDLWYCWQGVYNGNVLLYAPDMLYCWDATSNVWISVASVNNNATSRVVGVVNQTAEKLTSVYTDLKGNVSSLTQTVNDINSQISDITNNQTSSIHQTAKDIMMGVYSPEQSNYLGLLLSGMNSTSTDVNVVEVDAREDNPMWSDDGRCTGIPIWDGEKFVPTENSTEPKEYCIDVVNPTRYYEYADGVYHIYGINNIAMANLSTRVTDAESEVESWTRFQKGHDQTMTSINQTSDVAGAAISSMVYGDFRECVEIKLELTDEDISDFKDAVKYSKQPHLIIGDEGVSKKEFQYDDNDKDDIVKEADLTSGVAVYCISKSDSKTYYKLYYRDDNYDGIAEIVSYEKYKLKSSPYASLVQKVDGDKSYIGLITGNDSNTGSMVVQTINDKSEVKISADKITVDGVTEFSSIFNTGTTTINGNHIKSGVISSENYKEPLEGSIFAQEGTLFNLNDGTINTVGLNLDSDGKLSITGRITATSGYIGDNATNGFKIDKNSNGYYYLANNQFSFSGDGDKLGERGIYISREGVGLGNGRMQIDSEGTITINDSNNNKLLRIDNVGECIYGSDEKTLTEFDRNGLFFYTGTKYYYNVDNSRLSAGTYCAKINERYYVFTTPRELSVGNTIYIDCRLDQAIVNGQYLDINIVNEQPENSTLLSFEKKGNEGLGTIGSTYWNDNPELKGIMFGLSEGQECMLWTRWDSDREIYTSMFSYHDTELAEHTYIDVDGKEKTTAYKRGLHIEAPMYLHQSRLCLGETDIAHIGSIWNEDDELVSGSVGYHRNNCFYIYSFTDSGTGTTNMSFENRGADARPTATFYGDVYHGEHVQWEASDYRLKTNIVDADINAVELLRNIDIKTYDWINTKKHVTAGVIAQQLEEVIPEAVSTDSSTDLKSVSYTTLIPYLIKAIQELTEIVSPSPQLMSLDIEEPTKWTDDMTEEEKQHYVQLSLPPKITVPKQ